MDPQDHEEVRSSGDEIVVVVGTRPEVLHLAGVVQALPGRARIVHTGAPAGEQLPVSVFAELGLSAPIVSLGVDGVARGERLGALSAAIGRELTRRPPAAVVLLGASESGLAAALAAGAAGVPVVAVDAGVRSGRARPVEERRRRAVDQLADRCCAPTEVAAERLRSEGIPAERIVVTGSTLVDGVRGLVPGPQERRRVLVRHGLAHHAFVLAGFHRPEHVEHPEVVAGLLRALAQLSVPVVLQDSARLRRSADLAGVADLLAQVAVPSLPYPDFLALASEAAVIVTDTAAIQHEAAAVCRPVVVLGAAERPDLPAALVRTAATPAELVPVIENLVEELDGIDTWIEALPPPAGDGTGAARVVAAVDALLGHRQVATAGRSGVAPVIELRRRRPVDPTVTVVIPTLNEARNLPLVFAALPAGLHEVIVVDGRSSDDTERVAKVLRPDARIVREPAKGKGAALRAGFAAATGDIIVTLDADGSTDPRDVGRFVDALVAGADFAKGTRLASGAGSSDFTLLRRLGCHALNLMVNVSFGSSYTDINFGYSAFWRDCLAVLDLDAVGFEVEALVCIRAAKAGLTVVEVPSFEANRVHGESKLHAGRDGWRVLRTVARELRRPVLPAAPAEPVSPLADRRSGVTGDRIVRVS